MHFLSRLFLAGALAAASSVALAHPGTLPHAHAGFIAGLLHPFTGADHLAAMVAVGLWSALAVRPVWLAPAAFVTLLAGGALAGFAGLAVPSIEPMIAVSVLALGVLLALRRALSWPAAAALVGAFAFFHGAAHGAELAGGDALPALAGMLLASAALHAAGIALARVAARWRWLAPVSGAGMALFGAAMLLRVAIA
jgi:urease accessory protein